MSGWDRFKVVSAVFVPAAIALVGHWYTSAISEREVQAKFVELGVSILQGQPTVETSNLRSWATDILTKYSGVPIDPGTKKDLVNNIPFPSLVSSHKKVLLREGSLPIGKEWREDNSRAYLKFESAEGEEVAVTYDISYEGTEIKTVYFEGVQYLTFKGGESKFAINFGPYIKDKKILPVAVYEIIE